jgi:uncharacterized protein
MVKHGIELDSEAIRAFCKKWKVTELTAFGSILRDDFGPDSDLDFLIEWADDVKWDLVDYMNMVEELQRMFGRKVDLLSRYALVHDSNPMFRRSVLSHTERIYAV